MPAGQAEAGCERLKPRFIFSRIWDARGLQPHRVKRFNLSKDQRFVEKLTDVAGFYLNPPDKSVALCVDEESRIQALYRRNPFTCCPSE